MIFLTIVLLFVVDYYHKYDSANVELDKAKYLKNEMLQGLGSEYKATDPLYHRVVIDLLRPFVSPLKQEVPWQHAGGGFVSRRHRIVNKIGNQMAGFMPDDWQQAMAMGVFGKEELFDVKASQFLTLPLSKTQMLELNGEFRIVTTRKEPCLFWFEIQGDTLSVLMYRLKLIQNEDIREHVWKLLQISHPQIRGNLDSMSIKIDLLPSVEFYGYIFIFLLILLGKSFLLFRIQRILFKFELRLIFFILTSSLLVYLPFWYLHSVAHETGLKTLNQEWDQSCHAKLRLLEEQWPRWESKYHDQLRRTFYSGSSITDLLPENSTTLLIDDKKNPAYFPDDIDEFSQSVLNHFSIWVVSHIPHSGIKSVEEARLVFPITSFFVSNIARKRNYTDSPLIQASANGKVNHQSLFGRSYNSMWLASKPEETFRFQLLIWFSQELQKLYLQSLKADPNQFVRSGQDWIGRAPGYDSGFLYYHYSSQTLLDAHWVIQIHESELFAPVYKKHLWFQILTLIYFMVSLFLSFALSRVLMQPVSILKNGLQELLKNRFPTVSSDGLHKEGKLVVESFNTMSLALSERQKIAPYVPEVLISAFTKIKDSQLLCSECVILVSDVRGFTSISESHAPEEVVDILNAYFSIWQEQVDKNQGIVIRYIGDAIIAVFLKETSANYLQNATETALAVSRRLRLWNQDRRAMNQATIRNGCGLVMGELKLGVIGIESKREFLALGGMLERAEELEIQSKNASHSLVLCDELLMHNLKGLYDFNPVGNGYEIITKD